MWRPWAFILWPFLLAAILLWLWERWSAWRLRGWTPLAQFLSRKGFVREPREWVGRETHDRYRRAPVSERPVAGEAAEVHIADDSGREIQVDLMVGANRARFHCSSEREFLALLEAHPELLDGDLTAAPPWRTDR